MAKYVTILGRRWRLAYRAVKEDSGLRAKFSYCTDPNRENRTIVVRKTLTRFPRALMEILVHETLHAATWNLSEEAVEDYAHDVTVILWNAGYRMPEPA